jgi:hypothetical protein
MFRESVMITISRGMSNMCIDHHCKVLPLPKKKRANKDIPRACQKMSQGGTTQTKEKKGEGEKGKHHFLFLVHTKVLHCRITSMYWKGESS